MLDTRLENCWNEIPILRTWTCLVTTGDNLLILAFHIFSNRLGFEDARIILIYYFYFAKGAGDLKILQKEIGGKHAAEPRLDPPLDFLPIVFVFSMIIKVKAKSIIFFEVRRKIYISFRQTMYQKMFSSILKSFGRFRIFENRPPNPVWS